MNEDFTYDVSGNLTLRARQQASDNVTITYTYQRPHAVSSVNGSPGFVYDENGNLANDRYRVQTYDWDNGNRLKKVTGAQEVSFAYGVR